MRLSVCGKLRVNVWLLYHCRVQASKHASGKRLPMHWTLKRCTKNPSKESLVALAGIRIAETAASNGVIRTTLRLFDSTFATANLCVTFQSQTNCTIYSLTIVLSKKTEIKVERDEDRVCVMCAFALSMHSIFK